MNPPTQVAAERSSSRLDTGSDRDDGGPEDSYILLATQSTSRIVNGATRVWIWTWGERWPAVPCIHGSIPWVFVWCHGGLLASGPRSVAIDGIERGPAMAMPWLNYRGPAAGAVPRGLPLQQAEYAGFRVDSPGAIQPKVRGHHQRTRAGTGPATATLPHGTRLTRPRDPFRTRTQAPQGPNAALASK